MHLTGGSGGYLRFGPQLCWCFPIWPSWGIPVRSSWWSTRASTNPSGCPLGCCDWWSAESRRWSESERSESLIGVSNGSLLTRTNLRLSQIQFNQWHVHEQQRTAIRNIATTADGQASQSLALRSEHLNDFVCHGVWVDDSQNLKIIHQIQASAQALLCEFIATVRDIQLSQGRASLSDPHQHWVGENRRVHNQRLDVWRQQPRECLLWTESTVQLHMQLNEIAFDRRRKSRQIIVSVVEIQIPWNGSNAPGMWNESG